MNALHFIMEEDWQRLRAYFDTDETLTFKWREGQLKALQKCMLDNEQEICEYVEKEQAK